QQANRAAGGLAFEHAGEDFDFIRFLALGGMTAGTRLAAIQVALQILQRQLQPRRAAVDNSHQGRAMALASGGNGKQRAEGIAGHPDAPRSASGKGRQYTRERALFRSSSSGSRRSSFPPEFMKTRGPNRDAGHFSPPQH